jgi:hypothetical protein
VLLSNSPQYFKSLFIDVDSPWTANDYFSSSLEISTGLQNPAEAVVGPCGGNFLTFTPVNYQDGDFSPSPIVGMFRSDLQSY